MIIDCSELIIIKTVLIIAIMESLPLYNKTDDDELIIFRSD
jgi:hypothetical protein